MISNDVVERCLSEAPEVFYAKVEGDGYHYHLVVVSDVFQGKTKVSRQQWVYSKLKDFIKTGRLHAVSMKTLTREEWERQDA